jgi:hypothetical protein
MYWFATTAHITISTQVDKTANTAKTHLVHVKFLLTIHPRAKAHLSPLSFVPRIYLDLNAAFPEQKKFAWMLKDDE